MAKAANRAAAGAPSAPAARVAAFPMTFKLSQSGEELAEVAVFPKKGRVMRLIKPETITAGKVSLVWDGKDSAGKPLAPGVYYLRLRDAKGERVEELKVP
jgi:flagellar hook assembly protein FlgD